MTISASGGPNAVTLCNSPMKAVGGAPQPCTCSLLGWRSASQVCTLEGKAVLTEKSFNQCQFGGKIKVFHCQSQVTTGAAVVAAMAMKTNIQEPKHPEKPDMSKHPEKPDMSKHPEKPDMSKKPDKPKMSKKPKDDNSILAEMLCSGECSREQREKCGYFTDHQTRQDSQVAVDNQSKILAENYAMATKDESHLDDIDDQYYALREK